MKRLWKTLGLLVLAMMLAAPALAESVTLTGTVTAAYTHEVYATSSATVERVLVRPGQVVQSREPILRLKTTKVYAEQAGMVAAVFGQTGDLTDTLAERYGAAIYLEGTTTYTVSASTEKAYDSVDTRLVHVGEAVCLRSRTDEMRTGRGVITAVEGSAYTVQVTQGLFTVGDSVNLYRDGAYTEEQRIGRGDVAAAAPIAVTGTGRILSVAVEPGDVVERGELLMETLMGTGCSQELYAGVDAVVASLSAVQGEALEEDAVAAVLWPVDAMQVEALLAESELSLLNVGDPVRLVFDWNEDTGESKEGVVRSISALSDADSEGTQFTVLIDFRPDDSVRYGMNVTVTTVE